jgi:hypothetical protein
MSSDATTLLLSRTSRLKPFALVHARANRAVRTQMFIGSLAMLAIIAASLLLVAVAAIRPSLLVPPTYPHYYPHWLAGPLGGLWSRFTNDPYTLEQLMTYSLLGMYGCYLVALACAPRLRTGIVVAALVAVHIVFFLSPPLALTDIFNYLNYGRMEIVHHLNPYASIPKIEPHTDPTFPLSNWHDLFSPYGPLFTILTFALVPLGVAKSFWVMKGILMVASLSMITLVWRCALLLGRDPRRAAIFVGLNPIVLVWGLGGDHNDFITVFFIMLAFYLLLRSRVRRESQSQAQVPTAFFATVGAREVAIPAAAMPAAAGAGLGVRGAAAAVKNPSPPVAALISRLRTTGRANGAAALAPAANGGPRLPRLAASPASLLTQVGGWLWPLAPVEIAAGAALIVAVAIKASAAILLPVVLLGLLWWPRRATQALIGMFFTAVTVAVVSYIAFGVHIPDLSTQDKLITLESVPNLVGLALGQGGETTVMRAIIQLCLVAVVLFASMMAWRRREFVTPAGWVTLALILTLSWVLPWYLLWLLPLAALARSRLLCACTLVLGVYMILVWAPLAPTWYSKIGFYPNKTQLGRQHQRETKLLLH